MTIDGKDLFERLPECISQWSEDRRDLVELYPSKRTGRCYLETGDPHCSPEMAWSNWVAFAQQIIQADRDAREPSSGEAMLIDNRGLRGRRVSFRKLEEFAR